MRGVRLDRDFQLLGRMGEVKKKKKCEAASGK
jgi:hypothetical protein